MLYDAGMQPGYLSGGHCHTGPGIAKTIFREAGVYCQLHVLRGPGAAGVHGKAGHPHGRPAGGPGRPAASPGKAGDPPGRDAGPQRPATKSLRGECAPL